MKSGLITIFCLAILAPSILNAATFDYQYNVIDLGALPGSKDHSVAADINNLGQVVGWSRISDFFGGDRDRAVLWSGGDIIDLDINVGLSMKASSSYFNHSYAHSINDYGQIVGDDGDPYGRDGAFLWQNHRSTELIGLSHANDINNQGQVAGSIANSKFGGAALWEEGVVTDIGRLPNTGYAWRMPGVSARAINEVGTVVGDSNGIALVWNENEGISEVDVFPPPQPREPFPDLPPGSICGCFTSFSPSLIYSSAVAVNDLDQIIGSSTRGAFLWGNGVTTLLDEVDGFDLLPSDINSSSQIVGTIKSTSNQNEIERAFIWEPDQDIQDLNFLIDPMEEWIIVSAAAINNNGQIAATGFNGLVTHALLLEPISPVPEPWAWQLMVMGLGFVAFAARHNTKISVVKV